MSAVLGLVPWYIWVWIVAWAIGWLLLQLVKSPAGSAIGKSAATSIFSRLLK